MNAEVSPELVSQLRLQIALLQDQLARVTRTPSSERFSDKFKGGSGGCGHKDSMLEGSSNKSQVSSMTHEVICHLEKISTKLEQEVAKLVSHTSDAVRTRQTLRAEKRLQVGSLGNLL